MERKSIIAIVGAAAGVLVASSVAGVAVINAASASTTKPEAMVLTAAAQLQSAPVALPELPVTQMPSAPEATSTPEVGGSTPLQSATKISANKISAKAARAAVANASGGSVLKTSRVVLDGFDAYGVQVARTDGSVVTGFVDSKSGVIFSWVVDKEAPAVVAKYAGEEEYEEDESENEEYEEDEYKDEDHESDEDEERDNDDD
jgi:cobalamin biosynthesis protein CobT